MHVYVLLILNIQLVFFKKQSCFYSYSFNKVLKLAGFFHHKVSDNQAFQRLRMVYKFLRLSGCFTPCPLQVEKQYAIQRV